MFFKQYIGGNLFQKPKRRKKLASYWNFCIKFANLWIVADATVMVVL